MQLLSYSSHCLAQVSLKWKLCIYTSSWKAHYFYLCAAAFYKLQEMPLPTSVPSFGWANTACLSLASQILPHRLYFPEFGSFFSLFFELELVNVSEVSQSTQRNYASQSVSVRWSRTEDWSMSCLAQLYFLVCARSFFFFLLSTAYYLLWYSSWPISKEMLLSQLCYWLFLLEYILILWNSVAWFFRLYLQYWPRA